VYGSDDRDLLRARAEGEERVTPLELFFDLVYVFAVTQLSHRLLEHLMLGGALEMPFLLLVVWWAWMYTTWFTNWFDPARPPVRALLVAIMLALFDWAETVSEYALGRNITGWMEGTGRGFVVGRRLVRDTSGPHHAEAYRLDPCAPGLGPDLMDDWTAPGVAAPMD
jgi:hypothetical protein